MVDPGVNVITSSHPLALEPPSRRDNKTAIPPMPGSSTRINVEQPSYPLTLPSNLGGELSKYPSRFGGSPGGRLSKIAVALPPAMISGNKPVGKTSSSPAVRPGPKPTGQGRDYPQTIDLQDDLLAFYDKSPGYTAHTRAKSNLNDREAAPYDAEPALPGLTLSSPELKGKDRLVPKDTTVVGGGIVNEPAPGLPPTVNSTFPRFPNSLVET